MADIIVYIIDKSWYKHLSENYVSQNVNFWMSELKFNFPPESCIYFKIKKTNFIVGRGKIAKSQIKTKSEALSFFEINCGTPPIIHSNDSANNIEPIKCNEIADIQWLRKDQFYEISEDTFPKNTPVFKKHFTNEQAETINHNFENALIRSREEMTEDEEDEELNTEFQEGEIQLSTHKRRERNQKLIRQVKNNRKRNCEICNLHFNETYGVEYIEAHHKTPLYLSGNTVNSAEEIALLCSNCHNVVHVFMKKDDRKKYEEIKFCIQKKLGLL